MSHICLQIGQCGNQVGHELYSIISKDIGASNAGVSVSENMKYCDASIDKWFKQNSNGGLVARAVLIDTERKVIKYIKDAMRSNSEWRYDEDNCILEGSGGSANNWALGFNHKGPDVRDQVMDVIRKECECCDRLESFISFASSAGGTGSGIGSYLTEQVHEEFPNKYIFNCLVLPYRAGEVVVQNFNTLFTISKLYENSDAIFLFENDELHKITASQLQIEKVTFSDLNKVIAEQVASVFQPLTNFKSITDSILAITAHPQYKLLSMKTSPFVPTTNKNFETLPNWCSLKRNVIKTLKEPFNVIASSKSKPKGVHEDGRFSRIVGNVFLCRGLGADDEMLMENDNINLMNAYARWIPNKSRCFSFTDNRKFLNKDRFTTMVSNNSSSWSVLDNIVSKSWDTFIHKAYLHQYSKYGVDRDHFLEMFIKMENIVKNYKNL